MLELEPDWENKEEVSKLKLRPNNTVILHPVEEKKYSKEELKQAYEKGQENKYNTISSTEGRKVKIILFEEWFNKNYPE